MRIWKHCYCIIYSDVSSVFWHRSRLLVTPGSLPYRPPTPIGVSYHPSVIAIVPSLNAPPPRPCRSFVAVYARSPPLDLGYYSSLRCSYAPLPLFLSCSCAPVLSPPPPSRRSSYSLFMNTLHSLYTVPLIPSTYSAHPDHAHCYFELHCWPGYPVVAKVSGTFICGEALEVHFADGCRCDG